MPTIIEKLKLSSYQQTAIVNLPKDEEALFESLKYSTKLPKQPVDLIIQFVFSLEEMQQAIQTVAKQNLLQPQRSYLFLAYPKKASRKYAKRGIGRDDIFPFLHVNEATGEVATTGLKFSRMVSLDADFTIVGLQPLEANRRTSTVSGRVGDYQDQVPQLQKTLAVGSNELAWFQQLTAGSQRAWARFVYGVKTDQTQTAHLAIFGQAMAAKAKTIAAWRSR